MCTGQWVGTLAVYMGCIYGLYVGCIYGLYVGCIYGLYVDFLYGLYVDSLYGLYVGWVTKLALIRGEWPLQYPKPLFHHVWVEASRWHPAAC